MHDADTSNADLKLPKSQNELTTEFSGQHGRFTMRRFIQRFHLITLLSVRVVLEEHKTHKCLIFNQTSVATKIQVTTSIQLIFSSNKRRDDSLPLTTNLSLKTANFKLKHQKCALRRKETKYNTEVRRDGHSCVAELTSKLKSKHFVATQHQILHKRTFTDFSPNTQKDVRPSELDCLPGENEPPGLSCRPKPLKSTRKRKK